MFLHSSEMRVNNSTTRVHDVTAGNHSQHSQHRIYAGSATTRAHSDYYNYAPSRNPPQSSDTVESPVKSSTMLATPVPASSTIHCMNAFKRMSDMYAERKLCDVVLSCNNDQIQIHAHRVVLSSISDYFSAMFTNGLAEAHMSRIEINQMDGEALKALVDFIYTGHIELKESNVLAILSAANFLQLSCVIQRACDYLIHNISIKNCLSINRFSEEQTLQTIYVESNKFILENFTEIVSNNELLNEFTEAELCDVLASANLNVSREEQVYEAAMRWVSLKPETRATSLSRLLDTIKLPLLGAAYLAGQIETNPLLFDIECQRLLLEAAVYHMVPSKLAVCPTQRTLPRMSTMGHLICVGGNDNGKTASAASFMEKYECRVDKWTTCSAMSLTSNMSSPTFIGSSSSLTSSLTSLASSSNCTTSHVTKRLQFGVALFRNKLYVVGGRDGLKTLNCLECYDLATECWYTLPQMTTHRHGLQATFLANEPVLYAVGGHDGWSFLNSVERYDLESRVWCNVASMNCARSTLGLAVLGTLLYAVGGRDLSNCLDSVECFVPLANKWIAVRPMNKRRGGVAVTTLGGYLYAIGGHEVTSAMANTFRYDCGERYDPRIDQWTMISKMQARGREAIAISSIGSSYIYIAGGYDDGHKLVSDCERYDPVRNEWTKVQSLNYPRAGACLVHVPPNNDPNEQTENEFKLISEQNIQPI